MTKSRYPLPSSPKGWFAVAMSADLAPGDVKPLQYFERDLVLWRGEDGVARMLDAHCPHLGAHLGHGGEVVGNDIKCPFHAWEFGGTGACTKIPYAKKIPPKATIAPWTLCERNGMIMAWHDLEGGDPEWEVPTVPEYGDADWTDYVTRDWRIRAHNIDMGENQVDVAHFRYLHGTANMPETRAKADGPVMHVISDAGMTTPRGEAAGQIESTAYGFGFATIRFSGIVDTLLVSSTTPIDGEYVHTRFNFTVKKIGGADTTRGVAKAFIAEVSKQLEQDIPIWENKIYIKPPILCEGDGPIGLYRKWCRQFFPKGTFESLPKVHAVA